MDGGVESCARSVPKGVQADKIAIIAKQESRWGVNRVGNSVLALVDRETDK